MTADEYDTLVGAGTGTSPDRATWVRAASDSDGLCGTIGGVGDRRVRPAGIADERATGNEATDHD